MATDEWLAYGGTELVNLARTTALAVSLGIDTLWVDPDAVEWVETARGGEDYDLITDAPWYDPGFPASGEFAGIVPISIAGLDDSTKEATTTEYITSGGASSKPRNKTLSLPCNMVIVASTERGADFGKRWLDRVLSGMGDHTFCSGSDLHYYQWAPSEEFPETTPPLVHRRDVSVSRGTTVTRKRSNYCSATWFVTFTLVANDPFEYGEPLPQFISLGGDVEEGPGAANGLVAVGSAALVEESCPVYDYTPIYDPLYPALVAPPVVPNFYPDGWDFGEGDHFGRWWVRIAPVEPSSLGLVPVVTLRATGVAARMVRVRIWPGDADPESMCDPIWTAYVTYLPPNVDFIIDGEQRASYVWDGASPAVRRADSLVFGDGATPIGWDSFNDPNGLLITFDLRTDSLAPGEVAVDLSLVPKSD